MTRTSSPGEGHADPGVAEEDDPSGAPGTPADDGAGGVAPVSNRAVHQRSGRSGALLVVVALTVVGALVAALVAWSLLVRPTRFTAENLLVVLPEDATVDNSIAIAGVWTEVASSRAVLAAAAEELGTSESELTAAVTITQPDNVPMISIEVTASDADTAATWADGVGARVFVQAQQNAVSGYRLQQLAAPLPPEAPDESSGTAAVVGAGLVGGLAGGVLGRFVTRRREPATRLG
jgi:capsular polysaccharide biosynthesis protein